MNIGADSWLPPTQQVLDLLKQLEGFRFYGGYVGGADLFQNTPWPREAWDLLLANEIEPLPIYVPKQDCSEHPAVVAADAIAQCQAVGLHGSVAIDSEQSMSRILNFQAWLDNVCSAVNSLGWHPVTYAGAHYVGAGSFPWQVVWGQHEDVPTHAEALQYGPYDLKDSNGAFVAHLDADSADESFPLASFASPLPTPNPTQWKGILSNMEIGNDPSGNLIVVGNAPASDAHGANNLLVFTYSKDNHTWDIMDVTDNLKNTRPTDPRTYQVV